MTFLDAQAPIRRVWPAIIAGIALFLAGAVSIVGVTVFGFRAGFEFFPLLVLAIWPRDANRMVSLLLVFLGGIFTDWATGGIVGQWALVYTVIWGVLRPELRSAPYAFISLFLCWFATCGLAIILIGVSGWFVFSALPDFTSFGRQIIAATVALPIVLVLRGLLAKRFSDGEEWDS